MLISLGNHEFSIADEAVNLLTKNPFKFPRPKDMSPVIMTEGRKEPGVPFTFSLLFVFEFCARFMLNRVEAGEGLLASSTGINRTIFLYPWEFSVTLIPKWTNEITLQKLREEIIPSPILWSQFFYLEISKATIKYRPKPDK